MKIPSCSGYKYWTDCGYEYDCNAVHEEVCENCLCCSEIYSRYKYNPITGRRVPYWIAYILYYFWNKK